jgi:hypothetical protein
MSDAAHDYTCYLETLVELVTEDREQAEEAEQARTRRRDASEAHVRVVRQTETLLARVRRQLDWAGLPDLTNPPAAGAHLPTYPSALVALDKASDFAGQLSGVVDKLVTSRAATAAEAKREAADRERRRARVRRWALVALAVAIMVVAILVIG